MSATAEIENVETWSGKDRGDENFPVGSRLIERRYRRPMHCFYAFARNADDIADSPDLPAAEKVRRLDVMEDVLMGRRENGSPTASALRASLAETRVSPIHARELLIAFRRDATKLRYETIDELYDYCRYSAVPVGRYVLDLHGEAHECWAASDALCISLQILNHLQDCTRDLAMLDRCYLPLSLLRHFNCSVEDLRRPAETPNLRRVFNTLLDRVNRLNQAASELPEIASTVRLRLETAVILGLALRLTDKLMKNDPIAKRVKLTKSDAVISLLLSMLRL
ncbi:squalene synthase HpnC [Rhodopila sp.]|jgi:farnesyl-diphosphate farnesyltransferase|uniref:squalene synthase HpnC n=1 Tax=Rhodopila sp. TaxID=2480087 RepID=UPI002BA7A0D3|nr:squalene synthase HpnC [Rhodopila sp.]HVZ07361.1 squalene synthase HpnC [Rhodopila sp.]